MFGTKGENPKINPPVIERDWQRMKLVLDNIMVVWKSMPELRLCQLIANAIGHGADLENSFDIFYVEDEDLVKYLHNFKEKMNR
jgi:hypothetical protein